MTLLRWLRKNKNASLIVGVPLIFSLLPILVKEKSARCGYILIVMALFWIFECLPMGITGLIPVVAFPMLEIASPRDIAPSYFPEIIFLLLASFLISNVIESSGLNERIALVVFKVFGSEPHWILLGMMSLSAFLSMWIPNTAVVSMMFPIANSIIAEIIVNDPYFNFEEKISSTDSSSSLSMDPTDDQAFIKKEIVLSNQKSYLKVIAKSEKARLLATGYMLSCIYSTSIGGLCTLVGNTLNLYLEGFMQEHYPTYKFGFLQFSLFAIPIGVLMLIATWVVLVVRYLPFEFTFSCFRKKENSKSRPNGFSNFIKERYKTLGKINFEQACIGIIFLLLAVLLLTRDMPMIGGWQKLFNSKFMSDSIPSIVCILLLFVLPKKDFFKGGKYRHFIETKELEKAFPWNLLLTIGGGFALAKGFEDSNLSNVVLKLFELIPIHNKQLILFIILVFGAVATEFISNFSLVVIYIPIIDKLAKAYEINPVYFLIPVTFSISYSYMLITGSPKNAFVFTDGYLRMIDMVTTGLVVKLIGIALVFLGANTWLSLIYDLKFDRSQNATLIFNMTSNFSLDFM